ncbi:Alpha-1%2C4-N-acetylgalactosamine transferase PglJ %2C CAzY family GT4 [Campylobacter hyointestinalis subsp. hyointestinalis]|uniref:Alpha-1,4-N-acetylgalactosamine transferase PglJ, CAzY family GT4 n=3 Tax=Campylobacter hyointestinalis TaxID=198 RepID=A0A9W5ATT3_CAMHY|nr:glycosyltransferase [Campylobacter hyointestinalis]CUU82610.1 Alpha-1%2C4-N-acetylgalactosamine transferase PglJ %2C CAzY family GT4 [Campylobacter hyointestinalis subsp. hyointestinalis]
MSKIIIISNTSWSIYNFRFNLATALIDNGYEVAIVAPKDRYTSKLNQKFNVYNVDIDSNGINPIKDIKTIFELYKVYKQLKPDIVLNFTIKPNIYSSLICRYLKIPCISNITGLGTIFIKQNFITKIAKFLYKIALNKNKSIFFQNDDDKKLFLKYNLISQKNNIDVLPGSGVDLDKFKPSPKVDNDKFIFLFIGRLIRDKGISELIEASIMLGAKYDNFKIWLLGELGVQNNTAISQDELNGWLKNDFIEYLGTTDNVADIIAKSDCVVLPSYREGTPRSLLEAAAMAKPIITTNTVGCRDVVSDGINGLLCEVRNAKDLAGKMEKMLNSSTEQQRLWGGVGREKIIQKYDEKFIIYKYLLHIKNIQNYNLENYKMKKAAFLINSLEGGGAERVVSTILNNFVEKYECYLILMQSGIFYELDKRINIIYLDKSENSLGLFKFLKLPILAYKLARIIKKYKFEHIVSFLYRANYINVLSNLFVKHKTIINECSMPSMRCKNGGRPNGMINKFLIKMLYPKADWCLSNSYVNMMDLKNNFDVNKIGYIYNPLNIGMIEKLSKNSIQIHKTRFTFVTVGRLIESKNHKLIIEAIRDFNADLWIIGDGCLKQELQSFIKSCDLNDKVHLLGSKENPFSFLSKADCFIFGSNYEGFPNVLVEALACGLPIISTDCQSGPRELLSPSSDVNFYLKDKIELAQYGILIPIKNIEKMKEAIKSIMNDDVLRQSYKEKARQRANDFRVEKSIKLYEEIIFFN